MTYIEREAFQERLKNIYDCICNMSACLTVGECNARRMAMEMVFDALKEAPAADVAPVKREGWLEWVDDEFIGYDEDRKKKYRKVRIYQCPICGRIVAFKSSCCPNCGADMRED